MRTRRKTFTRPRIGIGSWYADDYWPELANETYEVRVLCRTYLDGQVVIGTLDG